MDDILREAQNAAQRAFRHALHIFITENRWDEWAVDAYREAERWLDVVEASRHVKEWQLDALHEATMAELDELRDALPDVPLAYASKLDEYQTRGA